jgi:glycogen operon protein
MAEWNARFRDDVRKFWRGDSGLRGALAARLQGSADLFDRERRRPWASINFITAHDGFTLQDLVSYNQKHNEANGEDNRDGDSQNESNNWGVEGPTDDAQVLERRDRVTRAMLATLLFSHGTPMLLGGDEFGRTQHGNNNAYCQDSQLSWYDWTLAQSTAGQAHQAFVTRLINLRRELSSLRCRYFQHGLLEPLAQVRDIEWFDENGDTMRPEDWQTWEGWLLCVRRAQRLDDGHTELCLLLANNTISDQVFQLPQPLWPWRVRVDTADLNVIDQPVDQAAVCVAAQSMQLLSVVVEGCAGVALLHTPADTAIQPENAPQPTPPISTTTA